MYVTLRLGDNGCCRIHSISDDGNGWTVTDEKYVVMPWKMVTRHGKNMTVQLQKLSRCKSDPDAKVILMQK